MFKLEYSLWRRRHSQVSRGVLVVRGGSGDIKEGNGGGHGGDELPEVEGLGRRRRRDSENLAYMTCGSRIGAPVVGAGNQLDQLFDAVNNDR